MKLSVLLFSFIFTSTTNASVIINTTRVIFPGDKKEATVRLVNDNKSPVLVQSWLDDGKSTLTTDSPSTPFVITPPMFKMDAGKGQSLRIMYDGKALPGDRESLFWLNVYEIPPRNKKAENTLQLSIRTRIKLIYRPVAIGKPATDTLAGKVSCLKNREPGAIKITCENKSPFYLSFSRVNLHNGTQSDEIPFNVFGGLAPFESKSITHGIRSGMTPKDIEFMLINDQGGNTPLNVIFGK